MTMTETTNETRRPTDKTTHSFDENPIPCFLKYEMISAALAPIIMGIDMQKENSAPTLLEHPIKSAPRIVAPDREVPGIRANA